MRVSTDAYVRDVSRSVICSVADLQNWSQRSTRQSPLNYGALVIEMRSRYSRNEGQRAGRILYITVNSYRERDQGHAQEKVITSIHGTTEGNTSSQKYTSLQQINVRVYTSKFKFKTKETRKTYRHEAQKCSNFPTDFNALDDGRIGWNMLCNRCAK